MKIVVFGDSIAYWKRDEFGGWVARLRNYLDATYNLGINPKNVQVFNQCIPWEVAIRLQKRISLELSMRITDEERNENNIVLVAVGVNDANPSNWMTKQQTARGDFEGALRNISSIVYERKAKLVFIGLLPIYEECVLGEYWKSQWFTNVVIQEYDAIIEKVARQQNALYVPMFSWGQNNSFANYLVDGIHPGTQGHMMVYERIAVFLRDSDLIK